MKASPIAARVGTALALCSASASRALADPFSAHATVSGYVAATDNVTAVSSEDPNGEQADLYTMLRPGILLSYEQRRAVYVLTAEIEGVSYLSDPGAWTVGGSLTARSFFTLSPHTEASLGADASAGRLNARAAPVPDQGPVLPLPAGSVDYRQVGAGQFLTHVATPRLNLNQSAFARASATEPGDDLEGAHTRGSEFGATLGADRTFYADAVGIQVGASRVDLEQTGTPMNDFATKDLILRGAITWRRDLNAEWTGAVDVGVGVITPLEGEQRRVFQPTYGVQAAYVPVWGSAVFALRRSVAPNLLLAQNTISDTATATINLPLPYLAEHRWEPRLTVQGLVAAVRSRLLDLTTGQPEGVLDSISSDVALVYEVRRNLTVAGRYQFNWQLADESIAAGTLGFVRNTIMFEARYRWPERIAGEIPDRNSLRVDRRDLTTLGDERSTP